MRTVRTVNAARVRKGLTGAMAWLLSLAVFSLSSAPVLADSEKRAPKEPRGDTADTAEATPSTEEEAPRKKRKRKESEAELAQAAPVVPPADAAPPAEPVAPAEPAEPVLGPSPEVPAETDAAELPPEVVEQAPAETEIAPPAEVIAPVALEEPNHTASYVLWTASVVSLGIGTAYGVMALKAKQDFDDNPTNKRADRAHDRGIAADVGLGLGVILAATGLAFYFAKDGGAKDTAASAPQAVRADVSVAPYVGRSAGGGNLSVRF